MSVTRTFLVHAALWSVGALLAFGPAAAIIPNPGWRLRLRARDGACAVPRDGGA